MKKLLTIFALLISVVAMGQEIVTTEFKYEYVTPDTTGKICKERGHVSLGIGTSTLAWCPPYQIDYADSTVMVYPACNTTSYVCSRCGETVSEHGKESRVVTWRRPFDKSGTLTDTTEVNPVIFSGSPNIEEHHASFFIGTPILTEEEVHGKLDILTFQMLLDYETYCLKDTIKAIKYECCKELLISFKPTDSRILEIATEQQLIDRGYKFVSRTYLGLDPKKEGESISKRMYFNYNFVKEATLKGFIQWYKEKVK